MLRKKKLRTKKEFADVDAVYDRALDLLSLREHGGDDMYEKLLLKGATQEQAQEVVVRLKQAGLIDELRYGKAVYRVWLSKKRYGRAHLVGTLTKKLVDKSVWDEILTEFTDEIEEQHAQEAARMFYQKYSRKKFENRRKLWTTAAAYMVNRGFGPNYMELVLSNFTSLSDD